ncbi:winged helix-turn-helix domain-containing protein [Providencia rettgeri]|nr:helix-turn-helix domain-containing protein [Providencia rettgeri]
MIYILNNMLQYNADLGEISRLDIEGSMTKLTPVFNNIFLILIENNETPITREDILRKILDKYNLKISMNTLNQYISMLRKLLHQEIQIENAILSISKKGLILSPEIKIKNSKTKIDNKKTEGDIALYSPPVNRGRGFIDKSNANILSIICVLLFLVIIYLFYQLYGIKKQYNSIESYKISTIGDCPVYGFKNTNENIEKQLADFNLTCEDSDVFYYYSMQELKKNNYTLLVKCRKNKDCISSRINWQVSYD